MLSKGNYNCIAIHGDKTQFDRNNALEKFKTGKVPILIGTNVIGRGIDFPNVSFIINFDTPKNIDDYIHRIGRTGRCGNTGIAISFINQSTQPIIYDLYNLLCNQGIDPPKFIKNMFYEGKSGKTSFNEDNSNSEENDNNSIIYKQCSSFTNKNSFYMSNSNQKMSWRK